MHKPHLVWQVGHAHFQAQAKIFEHLLSDVEYIAQDMH